MTMASLLSAKKNTLPSLCPKLFESAINMVNSQVVEIKKKLSEIYGGQPVQLGYIIVSKRINTRLFVNRGRSGDNPKPGTIIDDVVTLPERLVFN